MSEPKFQDPKFVGKSYVITPGEKKETYDMTKLEDAQEFVRVHLGFCCGYPESTLNFLHDVLKLINARRLGNCGDKSNWCTYTAEIDQKLGGCDSPHYWIFWYWLDQAGLLEHGTGCAGSWLTQEGEDFLAALDRWDARTILGIK